jgi:trehalose 6-phosphate phosphatase
VARPELARPVHGVEAELSRLAERYRLVAILTGRRSEEVTAILEVPGLTILGLYGFAESAPSDVAINAPAVRVAATSVPKAWVEDKGVSLAVHYRQAPDPVEARRVLLDALRPIVAGSGLDLIEGKMVLELVPAGRPMKGGAVERLAREHALGAMLYAGDDVADLEAFRALDTLAREGVRTVRVAVRGEETPGSLLEAADVVVEGPTGMLEFLRSL